MPCISQDFFLLCSGSLRMLARKCCEENLLKVSKTVAFLCAFVPLCENLLPKWPQFKFLRHLAFPFVLAPTIPDRPPRTFALAKRSPRRCGLSRRPSIAV